MNQTILEWFLLNVPGAKERVQAILEITPGGDPDDAPRILYAALITQSGVNVPVAVFEYQDPAIEGVYTWGDSLPGAYILSSQSLVRFPDSRTYVFVSPVQPILGGTAGAYCASENQVMLQTINSSGDPANGIIAGGLHLAILVVPANKG